MLALGLAMLLPACSPTDKEAERGNEIAEAADPNAATVAVAAPADPNAPAVAILPPRPGLPAVAVVPPAEPGAPPTLTVIPPDPNAPPVAVVPPPEGEVRVVIPVAADTVSALPDCSSTVEAHCVLNRKSSSRQEAESESR
jgi:hypothetical protein